VNLPASIAVTPIRVADLLAEGERMPVYVHVIDHPDARVLVDTGITELHPDVADLEPRLRPLSEQDFDLAVIDIVVNTHTCTSTTAAATTSSSAGRSTSPASGARRRAQRG
jgi:N-acyl homoserine lactone hydrolase